MARPDDDLLDRWLRAEESGGDRGDDDAAEAALTALFAALPLYAPAPGFADRVLTTVAPQRPARSDVRERARARAAALLPAFLGSPWGRAGLGLGLVAAAVGLPFLLAALVPLVAALRPALLAPAAAHALTEASGWVISGLRLWRWLAAFSRSLLTPLESPAVAAAMGACLLVSALALRLLHELFQRERNWTYVDPI
ncbi:MAG TPA: hypothetical protein VGR07_08860 [Thermoanaerobaculia bacterium]|jgi:hypothetical protein|nr:hypothetical protein [Thermoanaerobaculia bacterium]